MKRKALLDYAITVCANMTVIGFGIILFKEDAPWQTGLVAFGFFISGVMFAYKKGE
ncbi:hypothetical protein [Mailhella sp.]|uniref:hypothetical protein n=1 Tax=Mailhella sp. TaxID=1981029 RepID=UPI004063C550